MAAEEELPEPGPQRPDAAAEAAEPDAEAAVVEPGDDGGGAAVAAEPDGAADPDDAAEPDDATVPERGPDDAAERDDGNPEPGLDPALSPAADLGPGLAQ